MIFRRGTKPDRKAEALPDKPLPNSYWVMPGRWLAGEYPAGRTTDDTRARMAAMTAAGIDLFIDLTAALEAPPYAEFLPPNARHVRLAIPDHDVPADDGLMREILATVRAGLDGGRRIYLHCRAGIGRTGTTVACHFVEEGRTADEALDELNRLWRGCARSSSWPTVPETPEQVEYVHRWEQLRKTARVPPTVTDDEPLLADSTLSAARRLRERFHGALVGLAVGDALAAATQFRKPGTFQPVGDLLGGGPFDLPRGGWSDDTAMTLCLAESLLECEGFDARDQVQRYVRWQQQGHLSATDQCVGITANVSKALAAAQWRRQQFAGSHDPKQLDKETLVRLAPVTMYWFAAPDDAVVNAAEAARTTCQAPLVLEACRYFAACLHAALSGRPKAEVLKPPRAVTARLPADRLLAIVEQRFATKTPAQIHGGGDALDALEAALWCVARGTNYRESVLLAVNLGGDSDVVASLTGQLAGAHYGASAIPATWRNSLIRKATIDDLADRLLQEALLGLGG